MVESHATTPSTIWTIGHSTRTIGDFVALLRENSIGHVFDVRRFPGSRRHPQFGRDALARSLAEAAIGYDSVEALGGRRTPRVDSPNSIWRTEGFRGYADYMASAAFRAAIHAVMRAALLRRSALMCAELLWWQCHRSLIADDLALHGWDVVHILGPGKTAPHAFREPARLVDDAPLYDGGQASLL
ncbi:MAG TPA: DUF488 domain-containing protein [Dokdonella sp.]